MTYKIHFFIHNRVRTKLYHSRSPDYNRSSGRGAGFAWGDVPTLGQIMEAACVHDEPLGVAYLLSAELLRIANEFKQNVISLPQRDKNSVESEPGERN